MATRGVERRLVELVQRHRAHVSAPRRRVDGDDVVARRGQRGGQLPVAGADLEHARGRRRQRGAHEGDGVGGRARPASLGNPLMRGRAPAVEDRPPLPLPPQSPRMLNSASHAADDLPHTIGGLVVGPTTRTGTRPAARGTSPIDQRPAFVAFPESADDVVAIVEHARRHGLRVAPQGTGHNAGPLGDLAGHHPPQHVAHARRRRSTPRRAVARVAAGTLWLEVTEPASEHGLAPLAGSSPDVGVVGYCLGGGVSWLGRKHGLAANSVLAIELVTADGRLRRVDADNDPDLFWALRGGGGSFGIVTAMEIALYPVPELYAGAMWWPWERSVRGHARLARVDADRAGRGHLLGAHHADAADPRAPRVPARPRVRDDRRRDPRRPRVRRRDGPGAARPRAGDRHVRHGARRSPSRACTATPRSRCRPSPSTGCWPTCRPRRSTRSWPSPAPTPARR